MGLLQIYFDSVTFRLVYDNTSCKVAKPDFEVGGNPVIEFAGFLIIPPFQGNPGISGKPN
jgi:hypothetical protein